MSARSSRPTATAMPDSAAYAALLETGLPTGGSTSTAWSTSRCRSRSPSSSALPSRTQITRHDCVEGWSAIGKWTGVPLGLLLDRRAEAATRATSSSTAPTTTSSGRRHGQYYESIDLIDAFHPQTILAYGMNGAGPAGRPRRAAAAAGRAAARLQAGQIRHAHRGGRRASPASAAAAAASGRTAATSGTRASEDPGGAITRVAA